jgi:hypothetical protein
MLGQSPDQAQTDLFKNLLSNQLNPQHPLYLLAQAIPWKKPAEAFAPLYGRVGLPSHPIREMVALFVDAQTPLQPQRCACSSYVARQPLLPILCRRGHFSVGPILCC